jgi:hypothetical protein
MLFMLHQSKLEKNSVSSPSSGSDGGKMPTKDYVHAFRPNQIWYRIGLGEGPSSARQYFWDEYQNTLLRELQDEYEQGWEPITEVGPSAFKIRSYQKNAPLDFSDLVMWIVTLGFGLLMQILNPLKLTYYEPTEFRVTLRKNK